MANQQIERLEINRSIRNEKLLYEMVTGGLMIAGGYPLWLTGFASCYSDIDLYPRDWSYYFAWHKKLSALHDDGDISYSKKSVMYRFGGENWQLIHPGQSCEAELLVTVDMSAASCVLMMDEHGAWSLWSYYADDIRSSVCRVLTKHSWTNYRTKQYQRKGMEVIET